MTAHMICSTERWHLDHIMWTFAVECECTSSTIQSWGMGKKEWKYWVPRKTEGGSYHVEDEGESAV